jgi:hypothetical protein
MELRKIKRRKSKVTALFTSAQLHIADAAKPRPPKPWLLCHYAQKQRRRCLLPLPLLLHLVAVPAAAKNPATAPSFAAASGPALTFWGL